MGDKAARTRKSFCGQFVAVSASLVWLCAAALAQPAPQSDMIQTCVACHGRDGIARETDVPHLAGQNELYLLNQMRAFRSGARKHPEMRYITRHMELSELEALAAYYSALPSR